MQVAHIVIAAVAGYRLTGALHRWYATVRVLGVRRTLHGAELMWRIRTQRPFQWGGAHEIPLWPIDPTVPVLFEVQAIAFALVLVYGVRDASAIVQVLGDPVMIPVAVWALARASESVLPPCLLYLGVSESGQFELFRYLASSRAWLAVSAIDQADPAVNKGEIAGGPFHLAASLAFLSFVRLPWPRRRLESIRTTDDVWESTVRSLIHFVPLIVADLRSPSAIVGNELVWILETAASDKLLVVTRPEGTTIVTGLLQRIGIDLRSIARAAKDDQVNAVVAEILDRRRAGLPGARGSSSVAPESAARVAAAIRYESKRANDLLRELEVSKGPSEVLDDAIRQWDQGTPFNGAATPYTSSLCAAVGLMRRRLDKSSFSLHIGADETAWVDVAVQSIAESFRVSVSLVDRPLDSAAKAVIMGLLNAELGNVVSRRKGAGRVVHPLPPDLDARARQGWDALVVALPFLENALTIDEWRDPAGERTLATLFHIPHDTLTRDDEDATMHELQLVIEAVQGKGRYVPTAGPYSLGIHVSINGWGRAEVATRYANHWLIANSAVLGADTWLRPGVALMIAALKAEHHAFDGVLGRRR